MSQILQILENISQKATIVTCIIVGQMQVMQMPPTLKMWPFRACQNCPTSVSVYALTSTTIRGMPRKQAWKLELCHLVYFANICSIFTMHFSTSTAKLNVADGTATKAYHQAKTIPLDSRY